jgi:hypothetical protein
VGKIQHNMQHPRQHTGQAAASGKGHKAKDVQTGLGHTQGCDLVMGLPQVNDEHLAALTVLTQLTSLRLVSTRYQSERESAPFEVSPAGKPPPLQQ